MYKIERVVRRSFAPNDCQNIPKEGATKESMRHTIRNVT